MPKDSKSNQMDFKGLELIADEFTGTFNGTITTKPQITALVSLTNSTGGTANDTVQAVTQATAATTDLTAASLVSTNAALTLVNNDIADLTVKINAIITALKA